MCTCGVKRELLFNIPLTLCHVMQWWSAWPAPETPPPGAALSSVVFRSRHLVCVTSQRTRMGIRGLHLIPCRATTLYTNTLCSCNHIKFKVLTCIYGIGTKTSLLCLQGTRFWYRSIYIQYIQYVMTQWQTDRWTDVNRWSVR